MDNSNKLYVQTSLNRLNVFLTPDKQISFMIFLYSKFSKVSEYVINQIPHDCKQYFYFLCVDNPEIRKLIQTNIETVPSILLIHTDNKTIKYEKETISQIINLIVALNSKLTSEKQIVLGHTKLSFDDSQVIEDIDTSINEDVDLDHLKPRKKVKKPYRPLVTQFNNPSPQIAKGKGHQQMARSSLNVPDVEQDNEVDDGFDDLIDGLSSDDEEINSYTGDKKGIKKTPDQLKNIALELERERESLIKNE